MMDNNTRVGLGNIYIEVWKNRGDIYIYTLSITIRLHQGQF